MTEFRCVYDDRDTMYNMTQIKNSILISSLLLSLFAITIFIPIISEAKATASCPAGDPNLEKKSKANVRRLEKASDRALARAIKISSITRGGIDYGARGKSAYGKSEADYKQADKAFNSARDRDTARAGEPAESGEAAQQQCANNLKNTPEGQKALNGKKCQEAMDKGKKALNDGRGCPAGEEARCDAALNVAFGGGGCLRGSNGKIKGTVSCRVSGSGCAVSNCRCVKDACPNIGGTQEGIPAGMVYKNGGCYPEDILIIDVCPNIEGGQISPPLGYIINSAGYCAPPSPLPAVPPPPDFEPFDPEIRFNEPNPQGPIFLPGKKGGALQ